MAKVTNKENNLDSAIEYFTNINNKKITFELTAWEVTEIRLALGARMLEIWKMKNVDYDAKKSYNTEIERIYQIFVAK